MRPRELEIAFLDADQPAPLPTPPAHDERTRLTVLVVAAESDLRQYVRECLRERVDLRLLEAATAAAAVALAAHCSPELVVVDEPERYVLAALADLRAIVIVDELSHGTLPSPQHVRLLVRPFSAEGLLAQVEQLLGNAGLGT